MKILSYIAMLVTYMYVYFTYSCPDESVSIHGKMHMKHESSLIKRASWTKFSHKKISGFESVMWSSNLDEILKVLDVQ